MVATQGSMHCVLLQLPYVNIYHRGCCTDVRLSHASLNLLDGTPKDVTIPLQPVGRLNIILSFELSPKSRKRLEEKAKIQAEMKAQRERAKRLMEIQQRKARTVRCTYRFHLHVSGCPFCNWLGTQRICDTRGWCLFIAVGSPTFTVRHQGRAITNE